MKKNMISFVMIMIVLATVSCVQDTQTTTTDKWEYMIIVISYDRSGEMNRTATTTRLNELGLEGWEAVGPVFDSNRDFLLRTNILLKRKLN